MEIVFCSDFSVWLTFYKVRNVTLLHFLIFYILEYGLKSLILCLCLSTKFQNSSINLSRLWNLKNILSINFLWKRLVVCRKHLKFLWKNWSLDGKRIGFQSPCKIEHISWKFQCPIKLSCLIESLEFEEHPPHKSFKRSAKRVGYSVWYAYSILMQPWI